MLFPAGCEMVKPTTVWRWRRLYWVGLALAMALVFLLESIGNVANNHYYYLGKKKNSNGESAAAVLQQQKNQTVNKYIDALDEELCREISATQQHRPCNVCVYDNGDGGKNQDEATPLLPSKRSPSWWRQEPRIARIRTKGRFGNVLFIYAATIMILSREDVLVDPGRDLTEGGRLPRMVELQQQAAPAFHRWWPSWRDLFFAERKIGAKSKDPYAPYYQHRYWIAQFIENRRHLCYYFSMPLRTKSEVLPGPNDIVIGFRSFVLDARKDFESIFDENKEGQKRIMKQPYAYFEQILLEHQRKHPNGKVWIITAKHMRNDPVIKKLCNNFGAVLYKGESADADFQFMSFAREIVVTPSTFYWWAAFLASDGTTVHLPINAIPTTSPSRWCHLYHFPSTITVLYHDWYRNVTISNVTEASNLCNSYMEEPAPAESVSAFYIFDD